MWYFLLFCPFFCRAAVSLFERDHLVREIQTPIQLRQFLQHPLLDTAPKNSSCQGSRLLLLYSGLCPHCHVFAPTWSALARRMDCSSNEDLDIGAFECSSTETDRLSSMNEWSQVFHALNSQTTNTALNAENISPSDVCRMVVPQSFPTLLAAVPEGCQLTDPFQSLASVHGNELQYFTDLGKQLFWLPLGGSKSASELSDLFIKKALSRKCVGFANREEQNKTLMNYLSATKDSNRNAGIERWNTRSRTVNPDYRLHDAMLGVHHILGSWIFGESDTLNRMQVTTVLNFLLMVATNIPDNKSKRSIVDLIQFISDKGVAVSKTEYLDFVNHQLHLMGVPVPKHPEDIRSESKLCETNSCSVWTIMHVLAAINHYKSAEASVLRPCLQPFQLKDFESFSVTARQLKQDFENDVTRLCFSGRDTADAYHQLVYQNFNCHTCRGHFHEAYENCVGDRCAWVSPSPKELQQALTAHGGLQIKVTESLGLLLWLWRFHNIVNFRTSADKALADLRRQMDDKSSNITILYLNEDLSIPLAEDCPTCRHRVIYHQRSVLNSGWLLQYLEKNEEEAHMDYDNYRLFHLPETTRFLVGFYFDKKWTEFDSVSWNPWSNSFVEESLVQSLPAMSKTMER
eukprot:Gregarina_sp_Poly_1__8054@NODE_462_length_8193_cov_107_458651_g376_i0_p1_GENE_NODE_462_length_8193_cov_107_458651_g376_i0NODE_462_length_8193_cov_107_458651_g376_i0_p1_ORF_typecomplete_len630_score65_60Evr1_Alr/PF04777_13/2_9e10Thioredoxin/PF00085_20/0_0087TraF/PF13728_6/0_0096TraF/PF13728_6/8_7e03_NODE_462_length_8193_cov_107_458651_g376_i044256314